MTQEERMERKGWLTVAKSAELLGRHIATVYRLVDRGEVEAMEVGRTKYVRRASLRAYVGDALSVLCSSQSVGPAHWFSVSPNSASFPLVPGFSTN